MASERRLKEACDRFEHELNKFYVRARQIWKGTVHAPCRVWLDGDRVRYTIGDRSGWQKAETLVRMAGTPLFSQRVAHHVALALGVDVEHLATQQFDEQQEEASEKREKRRRTGASELSGESAHKAATEELKAEREAVAKELGVKPEDLSVPS